MDSDVFRKLCAGVKFTRKPASSTAAVEKPSEPAVHQTAPENGTSQSIQKKKRKKKKKDPTETRQQEINRFRNVNRISVRGTDISEPVASFEQLQSAYKLHSRLLINVQKAGFESPTPIQMQAIPVMLDHREIMAQAPTGSGKTAAFVIPILHHLREPRNLGFRALILAPTRELAKQTLQVCRQLSDGIGFRCHYIEKATTAANKFGPKSKQNFDVLVTTPNRLVFLLKHDPPLIKLDRVEWLVVDESDKLFESGLAGFRDQLAVIYNACSSNGIRRALFSATFASDVQEWCKLTLDNVVQVTVGARNAAAHSVQQELLFVGNESGKRLALRDIIRKGLEPPVLIFVQSKDRAKELFSEFIYDGINVDVIHAERTQLQRDNTVRSFVEGKIWVLICTELMGRGIDFKGINLVINYDFPSTAVSYIHRIGRTGRAGCTGRAVTFFTEDDVTLLRSIANIMREAGCEVPEYMLKLKKPSRQEKKNNFPVKRKRISTVLYDDQENRKKSRKKMSDETLKFKKKSSAFKEENKGSKKLPRKQKGAVARKRPAVGKKKKQKTKGKQVQK